MTEYEAEIVLADKPYQMINWFTKNFDKEIGAFGIGKIKDGCIYVEKLVFPNQIVNGAHVHFKPEDWAPIIKELPMEDIKKIIFYWHKHPTGGAGASAGDEDDTYDTIMDETSGRKIFGFLQTSPKYNSDDYDSEARIEIRKPIWASIKAGITTEQECEVEEECEKIIKDRITVGNASSYNQPGAGGTRGYKETYSWPNQKKVEHYYGVQQPSEVKGLEILMTGDKYIDEGIVFGVTLEHGNVKIEASACFDEMIELLINEDTIKPMIHKVSNDCDAKITTWNLQPNKKCQKLLFKEFDEMRQQMLQAETEEEDEEASKMDMKTVKKYK